jgi:hypothetical protein
MNAIESVIKSRSYDRNSSFMKRQLEYRQLFLPNKEKFADYLRNAEERLEEERPVS